MGSIMKLAMSTQYDWNMVIYLSANDKHNFDNFKVGFTAFLLSIHKAKLGLENHDSLPYLTYDHIKKIMTPNPDF